MHKWIQTIMLGLVMVSVASTAVGAEPRFGMSMTESGGAIEDGPGMLLPLLLRGVGLTADQKVQMRAIMDTHRAIFPELFKQLRDAHKALAMQLLAAGEVKAEDLAPQLQHINQLRAQLLREGTQVMLEVRQVLKPAQLAKAAQLKARMQALYDEMHSLMRGNNPGAGQDDNGPALSRNP